MKISIKKTITIVLDIALAVYLVFAFTAFNKPDETTRFCTKVQIDVADGASNGFIDAHEIKTRLQQQRLFPLEQPMCYVDTRKIEEMLEKSSFVNTVECFKTQDGHVNITITQRMPVIRIKADNGDDYYIDDQNCIMPNSHYTSDLIIATGAVSRNFAQWYLAPMSKAISANELWLNLIEQINVLPNGGIEIVTRVGNHIVYLGKLPESPNSAKRVEGIYNFVTKKLSRLEKFYKFGLKEVGWNKYSYINLEFDNQIICKKKKLESISK